MLYPIPLLLVVGLVYYCKSQGCYERNGRFPDTVQCDAYTECADGVPQRKLCPDGLFFNARSSLFSYPCQYPPEVDCEGRNQLQPAQATPECPHQFGYYRLGDAVNCGQFLNCANGRGYTMDCPEGLAYNENTMRCDWPDQVATCDAEGFLGFSCPNARDSTFGPEVYRYFRSPSNCQKYFLCLNGRPRLHSCSDGHAFNEIINACDGIENVTGCGGQFSSRQLQGFGNAFDDGQAQRFLTGFQSAEPRRFQSVFNGGQQQHNYLRNNYQQQSQDVGPQIFDHFNNRPTQAFRRTYK